MWHYQRPFLEDFVDPYALGLSTAFQRLKPAAVRVKAPYPGFIELKAALLIQLTACPGFVRRHWLNQRGGDPIQHLLVGDPRCHLPVVNYLAIDLGALLKHGSPLWIRREHEALSVTDSAELGR